MTVPSPPCVSESPSMWQFLALPDAELEKADVVAMNLSVARGIESLKDLDVQRYCRKVDDWTNQFARYLPNAERTFHRTPENWKNDIRFFRVGMLQGFLGNVIGIRYIDEQKKAISVHYTNPSDLFLNGLIDTGAGTCSNMPLLHVAIARRMGWPVSLACARNHKISRYADGKVVHNIEATSDRPGAFCSEEDDFYIKRFNLPRKAVECGSDLRKLTAREMIALFINSRARHYQDIGKRELCDVDCSLARSLFPNHRATYTMGMMPLIKRGEAIFNSGELGHPKSIYEDLSSMFGNLPLQGGTPVKVTYVPAPKKVERQPYTITIPITKLRPTSETMKG